MPFGEELWAFEASRMMKAPPNLKLCAPAAFVNTALSWLVKFPKVFGRFCESPSTAKPVMLMSANPVAMRSEEHTSELQSQSNLVCRLLLEKKKKKKTLKSET